MSILKPQSKEELEAILASCKIASDFDCTLIKQNSLVLILFSYGVDCLKKGDINTVLELGSLGFRYSFDLLKRKCPDQKAIHKRASYVDGYPKHLFDIYASGKLTMNTKFSKCLSHLSSIAGAGNTIAIVTRNLDFIVESYLESTYEFGKPVHEYIKERFGFDFLAIGNSMSFQDSGNAQVSDGQMYPGYAASLLFDGELVSIRNKALLYSGRIVLSDKEEARNMDLKRYKDYISINLQASHKHISRQLIEAEQFIQHNSR